MADDDAISAARGCRVDLRDATSAQDGITNEVVDPLLAGRDPATVFEIGGFGR
jgi:hypothetical protein